MCRRALTFIVALLSATAGWAHPEIQDALDRLATAITATPHYASLYLERGQLYAQHREWLSAEANFLRAAELSPLLPGLALARGSLALSTGKVTEARTLLTGAVDAAPNDPVARILRGRALSHLGLLAPALADYATAFRLTPSPSPTLYLERAAVFTSPEEALRSLDEAIVRLGPVMSLHLRALDLEILLGRHDDALARVDLLASTSERSETWLKRRGDILASAGRPAEARIAYVAAHDAIKALPTWLVDSPDTIRLASELVRLATNLR